MVKHRLLAYSGGEKEGSRWADHSVYLICVGIHTYTHVLPRSVECVHVSVWNEMIYCCIGRDMVYIHTYISGNKQLIYSESR